MRESMIDTVPLSSAIERSLAACGHVRRLKIIVVETADAIILRGHAPSYFMKQMATEGARRVLKNKNSPVELRNEIVVLPVSGLQPADTAVSSFRASQTEPRGHDGNQEADLPATTEGEDQPL